MKKISPQLIFAIVVLFVLSSCSTGKKAFERGDYYSATMKAINRLRANPDSKNATKTLVKGYPYAVEFYETQIEAAKTLNDPLKYSKVVSYYEVLNQLASEIDRSPAAKALIDSPNRYYVELAASKLLAAEERYQHGILTMDEGTRMSARTAYYHFIECDKFSPGYKDVIEKLNESHYYATLKVLVEPITAPGFVYRIKTNNFYNSIIQYLETSCKSQFIQFLTPMQIEVEGIVPDQYLRMEFSNFTIGRMRETESTEVVKRDSVVVGYVTLDDGTVLNAYNTVKANLINHQRQIITNGTFTILIVDTENNQIVSEQKFPNKYLWNTNYWTFEGDERALSPKQIEMTGLKAEPAPRNQLLFDEFSNPIINQANSFFFTFYGPYK